MADLLKKDWVLTQEAFERLLRLLDADRELAGHKYEELRNGLGKFFEWRGATFPEECADETLNRAARQIAEGKEVRDLYGYCHGIARLLLLEVFKRERKEHKAISEMPHPEMNDDSGDLERQVECLDRCLHQLSPENRSLITQYYQGEKSEKIENRKKLSEQLNLSEGTLRMRALRLRETIEGCVTACLEAGAL